MKNFYPTKTHFMMWLSRVPFNPFDLVITYRYDLLISLFSSWILCMKYLKIGRQADNNQITAIDWFFFLLYVLSVCIYCCFPYWLIYLFDISCYTCSLTRLYQYISNKYMVYYVAFITFIFFTNWNVIYMYLKVI